MQDIYFSLLYRLLFFIRVVEGSNVFSWKYKRKLPKPLTKSPFIFSSKRIQELSVIFKEEKSNLYAVHLCIYYENNDNNNHIISIII